MRVHLKVSGMSCGHCVGRVQKALAAVEGVAVQGVGIGFADLELDETRQNLSSVLASIEKAGYRAVVEPAGTR